MCMSSGVQSGQDHELAEEMRLGVCLMCLIAMSIMAVADLRANPRTLLPSI